MKPIFDWLNVLRLLCAIEIVAFHWLRAAYKANSFGCSGALNVVTDYKNTTLGWVGILLPFRLTCEPPFVSWLDKALAVLFGYGWEAVNVFIVISGFALMLNLPEQRSPGFWKEWYLRRIRRILIPYYQIALPLITIFLLILKVHPRATGFLGRIQIKLNSLESGSVLSIYLKHIFFVDPGKRQWVASFFAPAWWFIPAILVAYICFPMYLSGLRRLGLGKFLLLSTCISVASYALTERGLLIDNAWYFAVLNESFSLSLGVAAGAVWRDSSRRVALENQLRRVTFSLAGIVLVILGNLLNDFYYTYPFSSVLYTLGLTILGFQIAQWLAKYIAIRKFATVDAFRLYLIHQPLAAPTSMVLVAAFGVLGVPLGLPLFIIFAYLLTRFVQRLDALSPSSPKRPAT